MTSKFIKRAFQSIFCCNGLLEKFEVMIFVWRRSLQPSKKCYNFFVKLACTLYVRRTMRCYNALNIHIVTNPTKGQTPHLSSFSAGYYFWSFLNIFGVLCCILKTEIIFGTRGTLSINLSWLINFFSKIENGKKQCRNSRWIVPSSSKQHTGKRKIALRWLLFFWCSPQNHHFYHYCAKWFLLWNS